jgi:hypothetical protein
MWLIRAKEAADAGVWQPAEVAAAPTHADAAAVRGFGVCVLSASSHGALCTVYRFRAMVPPQVWVLSPAQAVLQLLLVPRDLAASIS